MKHWVYFCVSLKVNSDRGGTAVTGTGQHYVYKTVHAVFEVEILSGSLRRYSAMSVMSYSFEIKAKNNQPDIQSVTIM